MNKPESVFENETYKILWDFKIQTDYQNPSEDQTYCSLTTCHLVDLIVPAAH